MKFLVPVWKVENLERKIKSMAKKCPSIHFEKGDVKVVKYDIFKSYRAVEVIASGEYRINGWKFVATLDHTENGNIIRKVDDSVDIPDYYKTCKPYCDHCKTIRYRKDTYLIANDNGEIKQVGKNCLQEYTNGLNAEICASIASTFEELEGSTHCSGDLSNGNYSICDFKKLIYTFVKKNGYKKGCINDFLEVYKCLPKASDEEIEEVDHYATELTNSRNDFLFNSSVAWLKEYTEFRDYSILAAFVNTFFSMKHKSENGSYVGDVGDRIEVYIQSFRALYTKAPVCYGAEPSTVYRIVDNNNNVYVWSTNAVFNAGDIVRATIKEHKMFNGEKQTVITRGKLA